MLNNKAVIRSGKPIVLPGSSLYCSLNMPYKILEVSSIPKNKKTGNKEFSKKTHLKMMDGVFSINLDDYWKTTNLDQYWKTETHWIDK